mmetsp:Transcript_46265/g.74409  ORF Transcript_46265/g.74409 Transcript_46265/m.74409 type:complete len:657 (+) Transcript_46265:90-2060(+)
MEMSVISSKDWQEDDNADMMVDPIKPFEGKDTRQRIGSEISGMSLVSLTLPMATQKRRDSLGKKKGCCCCDEVECCEHEACERLCRMLICHDCWHRFSMQPNHPPHIKRRMSKETRFEDDKFKFLLDLLKIRKYWPKNEGEEGDEEHDWNCCGYHWPVSKWFHSIGAPKGWLDDYMFFFYNNHPLFSIFYSEELHPFGRYKRMISEFVVQCWCFFAAVYLDMILYPYLDKEVYPKNNLNFYFFDKFIFGLAFITGPAAVIWLSIYGLIACPCLHYRSKSRCQHWCKFWGKKCGKLWTYIGFLLPCGLLLYLGFAVLVERWNTSTRYHTLWLLNWALFRIIGYISWVIRTMLTIMNWKYQYSMCCCYCVGQWRAERDLDMSPTDYWRIVGPGMCLCCGCCDRYPPSIDTFSSLMNENENGFDMKEMVPVEEKFHLCFEDSDEEPDEEYLSNRRMNIELFNESNRDHRDGNSSSDGEEKSRSSRSNTNQTLQIPGSDIPGGLGAAEPRSTLRRQHGTRNVRRQSFVKHSVRLSVPRSYYQNILRASNSSSFASGGSSSSFSRRSSRSRSSSKRPPSALVINNPVAGLDNEGRTTNCSSNSRASGAIPPLHEFRMPAPVKRFVVEQPLDHDSKAAHSNEEIQGSMNKKLSIVAEESEIQ